MLAAANRMRTAADFSDTTRRGAKASRGCVVVYVRCTGDSGDTPPVVGMVVGKAVGNSVVRHRASRRLRAAVRPLLPTLPSGSRVVVRALPGADADPALAAHLSTGLESALRKAAGG